MQDFFVISGGKLFVALIMLHFMDPACLCYDTGRDSRQFFLVPFSYRPKNVLKY